MAASLSCDFRRNEAQAGDRRHTALEIFWHQGREEMKTLKIGDAESAQGAGLLLGFDALGDGAETEFSPISTTAWMIVSARSTLPRFRTKL